ncbi:MAG: alpha-amylase [Bacillota bacterium]
MDNPVMLQAFYWEMNTGQYAEDYPEEENLWNLLAKKAAEIAASGFDLLWLPPANKGAAGTDDVGYGTYDLWDLGEFEQKGTQRTKYGTKAELEKAIKKLHQNNLKVIYDAVLNHRLGADAKEIVELKENGEAEVWTVFNFPGRKNKYSDLKLDWQIFDGVDWDERSERAGEFLFKCKEWDDSYEEDYLMGADIDYENQIIRDDVIKWGKWIVNELDFDGFRFDASKHVDNSMIHDFIEEVNASTDKNLLFIGEAWVNEEERLIDYLKTVDQAKLHVFDFPLREKFVQLMQGNLDLRSLGDRGLVNQPDFKARSITFVENHDTERDGKNEYGTETIIKRKLQAYAYILMRKEGVPSIFWKDYYIHGLKSQLDKLISARKKFAYGPAYESEANDENTYSYIRAGSKEKPNSGLVMMITQAESGEIIEKKINTGQAETTYYDYTGNLAEKIRTDKEAEAVFKVKASAEVGYSIWVPQVVE